MNLLTRPSKTKKEEKKFIISWYYNKEDIPLWDPGMAQRQQVKTSKEDIPLWEPGMAQRQPLVIVASSKASHNPVQVGGSVYRNELSWWGTTSPPIPGCWEDAVHANRLCKYICQKCIQNWDVIYSQVNEYDMPVLILTRHHKEF